MAEFIYLFKRAGEEILASELQAIFPEGEGGRSEMIMLFQESLFQSGKTSLSAACSYFALSFVTALLITGRYGCRYTALLRTLHLALCNIAVYGFTTELSIRGT